MCQFTLLKSARPSWLSGLLFIITATDSEPMPHQIFLILHHQHSKGTTGYLDGKFKMIYTVWAYLYV